ncbi:MAG: hypothetical protein QW175_06830 [Candidatus Bathyarchaeia archaeon]
MQSFSVQVGASNVTDYVKRIEVWRKSVEGVGRFQILLYNPDGYWNFLNVDSEVTITVDNATLMKGYVRRVSSILTHREDAAVCEELVLNGFDYGDWLLTWVYDYIGQDYPQNIINAFLQNTELTLEFAGSPSQIYYDSRGMNVLLDMIREIAELIDYDFFVTNDKKLKMFPHDGSSNHPSSGITLQMEKGSTSNNIFKIVEYSKDVYERRNYIIVRGPTVDDGWTEFNASDWQPLYPGVQITDYTGTDPTSPRGFGVAAIKATKGTSSPPGIKLTFPHFWHYYLDFSKCPTKTLLTFQIYNKRPSPPGFYPPYYTVKMVDVDNNVIKYVSPLWSFEDIWLEAALPIGPSVEIVTESCTGKWIYESGSSFNWKIKELQIIGCPNADYMLVDVLNIPIEMYACSDQSGGGRKYVQIVTRKDLQTQVELQAYANQIANKRKDPIERLSLCAIGDVGLINNEWRWLPGYRVSVNIPVLGIFPWLKTYRFVEIHHVIERPGEFGWNHRVEVGLVPATAPLETLRWIYTEKGDIAIIRHLRDRVKTKEWELNQA